MANVIGLQWLLQLLSVLVVIEAIAKAPAVVVTVLRIQLLIQ